MANPIIKIKRGSGLPPVWNGSVGITAGEFAFDRDQYTLYLGIAGGGFALDTGAPNPSDSAIVIPIGMQISNDITFGGVEAIANDSVGYSIYTVPTTYAVREYIATAVQSAAAGIEFVAGAGIAVSSQGSEPTVYTVTNTGVLKGYTAYGFTGNSTGFTYMDPDNRSDFLYYKADSGIEIIAERSASTDQIRLLNTGVTGIMGATGNIKSIDPIQRLSGFTLAIGRAMIKNLNAIAPITLDVDDNAGKLTVRHLNSNVTSGLYPATDSTYWKIPNITVDATGHITSLSQVNLDISNIKPAGFTEAVQDAAYPSIVGTNGITFVYNDGEGKLVASLNGILTLNSLNTSDGLCGDVKIGGGNGILVDTYTPSPGIPPYIQITNTANTYRNISIKKADSTGLVGGIYSGGTLGSAGDIIINADTISDTLNIYAGRGIGISAGDINGSVQNDDIIFWNAGINTIQFRNGGTDLGGGMSGDVVFSAGNNINLTRIDDNTISITANVGGEGLGFLRADYAENVTDLNTPYQDEGLTGNIEVIGLDGLITKQSIGDLTKNGDLYVGLSSKLVMPIGLIDSAIDDFGHNGLGVIKVPTAIEMLNNTDQWGGYAWNSPNPEYNMERRPTDRSVVIVDSIRGGLTGTISYGSIGSGDPYSPNEEPGYSAGKVLTLWAAEGEPTGASPTIAGRQAEVRLLGWPTAEHLGAELDLSIVTEFGTPDLGGQLESDPCGQSGNGSCVGFPTVLPSCATGFIPDGFGTWEYTNYYTGNADRPVVKMNGNVILKDSIYIDKDIWIKGNILDATTGCLFNGGNGNAGEAVTCIECLGDGNVGITGSAYVADSIIVSGISAHFNVDDFAIESSEIRLGSSGGQPLSGSLNVNSNARGIASFQRFTVPGTPFTSVAADPTNNVSFIGVNPDGRFTFIPQASKTDIGGVNWWNGNPGSAMFNSYNGVGLTANTNGVVQIKAGTAGSLSTDLVIQGHLGITGSGSSTNKSLLNLSGNNSQFNLLGNNSKLNVGTSDNTVFVQFLRGITFNVATAAHSGEIGNAGNNLQLTWAAPDNNSQRRMYVRNLGETTASQLVDVGRHFTTVSSTGDLVDGDDSGQQTLWNKTLADGTIIDCGTY